MTNTQTKLINILGGKEEKKFTFDFSFWSFDGFGVGPDGYTYPLNDGKGYKD